MSHNFVTIFFVIQTFFWLSIPSFPWEAGATCLYFYCFYSRWIIFANNGVLITMLISFVECEKSQQNLKLPWNIKMSTAYLSDGFFRTIIVSKIP